MTGFTLIAGLAATYFVTGVISDPVASQAVAGAGILLSLYVTALTEGATRK